MKALFGESRHSDADAIERALIVGGASVELEHPGRVGVKIVKGRIRLLTAPPADRMAWS